eukprot:2608943-Rhodomonas_salina.1
MLYLITSGLSGLFEGLQKLCFSVIGRRLANLVRNRLFSGMIIQVRPAERSRAHPLSAFSHRKWRVFGAGECVRAVMGCASLCRRHGIGERRRVGVEEEGNWPAWARWDWG